MKPLVIVDSEAKAKTLASQADIEIDSLVIQAPPMVVKHDPSVKDIHKGTAGFMFSPSQLGKECVEKLKTDLDRDVIFAFDNDQRGDYWSWMFSGYVASLGKKKLCKRLAADGFSREYIKKCLENLEKISGPEGAEAYIRSLFNAFLIRHLKRLIGTSSGPADLALDYTTLTILFLLKDRQDMMPPSCQNIMWHIQVKLSGESGEFAVALKEGPGILKNGLIAEAEEVKSILSDLSAHSFVVEDVKRKQWVSADAAPVDLSEIFSDGYCLCGMSPKETWLTLLKLYHGVECDGVSRGLISDPYRGMPDGSAAVSKIREFLRETYEQDELYDRECGPKTIFPLQPELSGGKLRSVLEEREILLYDLIRSRALMSQMIPAEGEEVSVRIRAGDFVFRGTGLDLKKMGFLREDSQYFKDALQPVFSKVKPGDTIQVLDITPKQVSDPSSGQYTLSSLINDLREFSIPLSSRLPVVFQRMVEKNYIKLLSDGSIVCLENTKKVVDAVNRVFPKMQGINLSAYYEQTVTEVISGRKDINFALKQFDQNFHIHGVALVKKSVSTPVIPRVKRSTKIIKGSVDEPSEDKPVSPPAEHESAQAVSPQQEESSADIQDSAKDFATVQEAVSEEGEPDISHEAVQESINETPVESAGSIVVEEELENDLSRVKEDEEISDQCSAKEGKSTEEQEDIDLPDEQQDQGAEYASELEEERPQGEGGSRPTQNESGEESQVIQENKVNIPCPFCDNDFLSMHNTSAGKEYYECPVSNCEFIAWARPRRITCPKCKSPYLVEKQRGETITLQCPKAGCGHEEPIDGEREKGAEKSEPGQKKKKVLVRRKKGGSVSGGSKKRKVVVRRKRA